MPSRPHPYRLDPSALRRWRPWLALFGVVLLVGFSTTVGVVSAAFTAKTTNGANSIAAAASFSDYPTAVKADSPLFYHRLDDSAGSATAADSSGNGLTGVYGTDQANQPAFLAPFDEGSGSTAKDLSGVAAPNDMTLTNVTWASGHAGTAGSFNGTSSYGATSASVLTTTSSFSVSAWMYLTATGANKTAVSQDGANVSGFYLQYDQTSGRWRFTMPQTDSTSATGDLVTSTAAPTLNTWTHLVGVYDSTAAQIKLYVNGVLQGTAAHTTSFSAGGNLTVGAAKFTSRVDWWSGRIDDVRVFSYALVQARITELADGISAGPSTNYTFTENTGTTTADTSGNMNTGTFGAGASWTTGKSATGVALSGTATGYVTGSGPAVDTSASFTVSAWVYLTDVSAYRTVVSQDGTTVSGFYLQYHLGLNKWCMNMYRTDDSAGTNDVACSSAAPTLNTWTHLVGVYDSVAGTIALYVNNVLQTTTAHPASFNATGSLVVGAGKFNSRTDYVAGNVDDVRTYRRALSATEVGVLYNGGSGGAPTLGHTAAGQPGALQGAQQGQKSSTSVSFSNAGNGYNPTRYVNPTTFSLECWFQSSASGGTIMDFGNNADGNSTTYTRRIQLTATGAVIFGVSSGIATIVQSAATYLDGNWHHVVATVSPTAGSALYLDGTLVGTQPYVAPSSYAGEWRWGGDTHNGSWPSPDYFTGRIDEIAVYGTVLSAQQVAWHYHANH